MLKVKIISDGTSRGTQVIDTDTGLAITGIVGVSFELEAGMPGLCRITQVCRPVSIEVAFSDPEVLNA